MESVYGLDMTIKQMVLDISHYVLGRLQKKKKRERERESTETNLDSAVHCTQSFLLYVHVTELNCLK